MIQILLISKQKLLSLAFIIFMLMSIQHKAEAQRQLVSGKVTDSSGEGLPGVSVIVKGTDKGVATDLQGEFRLPLEEGEDVLIFRFIGYKTKEVKVQGSAKLNVALEEATKELEEVVVVGYGTQKKATLTGSVAQIGGEQIKQAPPMNITNTLAGRLPGLVAVQQSGRPGADDAVLRIRGLSTTGNNAPMVLVDGIQRDLSNLDPNEIESISILKDATAAVYGVQAANGVILVTTKQGSEKKPSITYTGSVSSNSNTRFPEFLNGPDYMYWLKRGEEMDNDYLIATGKDPIPLTYTDEEIDALRNGTSESEFYGDTDWVGNLVDNTATTQQHNVTIDGGTEKVRYFTSLGYFNQEGVVENTDFTRYNLRTNLDVEFNEVLSANLGVGGRVEDRNNPGVPADNGAWMSPFYQAVRIHPNLPATAPNGMPVASRSGSGYVNPIASIGNSGYQQAGTAVLQTNLAFNVKVPAVEGLNLKLLTSYDRSFTETKKWLTPYNLMARERTSTGWYWREVPTPTASTTSLVQGANNTFRSTFQPSINYERELGDHNLGALFLYEFSMYGGSRFSAGARNFALGDIQELRFGSQAPEDFVVPSGSSSLSSRSGYVGRLRYGFKNKYLAEVSARYDGSVNFPEQSRWGLFPAVSAGWVVSSEPFLASANDVLSFLKLKGSWGKLGNDRIGQFQYLNTFSLTSSPVVVIGGNPVSALYTNHPANYNLTWETATITNVGFESSFWNGLLDVDVEWFYKVTRDILRGQSGLFPPSLGGNYPATVNSGIVDNRGIDLRISHRNRLDKLQYGITGNLNWARNKILSIDDPSNIPEWQRRTGRSIGEKMGYISEGLFQSWEEVNSWPSSPSGAAAPGFIKYRDLNGDGQINIYDMTFIGRSNVPELMFGLNLDVTYGPFDFAALFQGAALTNVALSGTYEGAAGISGVMDNTPFTRTFYNFGNTPYYLVEDSWTPENPDAAYPRLQANRSGAPNHNGWANSQFVKDASYVRLKSVQLGYTMRFSFLESMKIEKARLYLAGANLFTWDKLKYIDPEMPNVSNGFYPQQRVITFGANVTF